MRKLNSNSNLTKGEIYYKDKQKSSMDSGQILPIKKLVYEYYWRANPSIDELKAGKVSKEKIFLTRAKSQSSWRRTLKPNECHRWKKITSYS